jgi:hypothetical protein
MLAVSMFAVLLRKVRHSMWGPTGSVQ